MPAPQGSLPQLRMRFGDVEACQLLNHQVARLDQRPLKEAQCLFEASLIVAADALVVRMVSADAQNSLKKRHACLLMGIIGLCRHALQG